MPTPRPTTYSAASGAGVYAGIASPALGARTALIGDSLTDKRTDLNRNLHPFWWLNGLGANGGMKLVANAGNNGDTAAQMLARVNNAYTAGSPGLAGLGSLGRVFIRGFANDARAGSSWATIESDVLDLLTACKSYCERVVILSASPIGTPDSNFAASNALQTAYNVELAALAAANPTLYVYADDNVSTRDGSAVAVANCFTDGVHTSGRGIYLQGVDGATALTSHLAGYSSPLVTDAGDVYPTTQQLVPNHLMTGTGGTAGTGMSGSVATDWTVSRTGSANTATVSKVAAGGGDPNTTAWQRIAPTQVNSGDIIRLSAALLGGNTANTQNAIEMMFEVRFNALDSSKFSVLRSYVTTDSGDVTTNMDLKMGAETITKTLTVRHALPRSNSSSFSNPTLRIDLVASASFTGSMGSIDIRNATARQE